MNATEILKDHLKILLYPLFVIFFVSILNPYFTDIQLFKDNPIIKETIILVIIIIILIVLIIITRPNLLFSYRHFDLTISLNKSKIPRDAKNVQLIIQKNASFIFNNCFSYLINKYRNLLFYQIYWEPKEAILLDVTNTEHFDYIDEFPSIPLDRLSEITTYILKLSVGNMQECGKIKLCIRKKCRNNTGLLGYILFHVIKIKGKINCVFLQ